MVSEEEWTQMRRFFEVDAEISVSRNKASSSDGVFCSEPAVCHACVLARHRQEEAERLRYRNEPVYVRQVTEKNGPQRSASATDSADPDYGGERPGTPAVANGAAASEVKGQGGGGGKRSRVNGGGDASSFAVPSPALLNGGDVRRSNRRQRVRGDREIVVSSDMKLRDLKVKVRILNNIYKVIKLSCYLLFTDHGAVQGGPVRPAPDPGRRPAV